MKKLTFLFTMIYLTLMNLSAQDIVFTFNSKDASNAIDSIKATNVVTGETAFAEGSNTINLSSFSTGTKLAPKNFEEFSVYPNPFENLTQLKFYSSQNDRIKVSLINAKGQVVAIKYQNINPGIHRYNISVKTEGLYIINVTGNQKRLSQKIISTKNNQSLNEIEYVGYSSKLQNEKSGEIKENELIHFFIYSGDNITKIVDSPTESKTYEVEFYECKDEDGNNYPIVQIGDQWWMTENLAYLPRVSPFIAGAFNSDSCFTVYGYIGNNINEAKDEDNYGTYGVLYNWTAASASCPIGWHLPSDDEWEQLRLYVDDQKGPFNKDNSSDVWFEMGKHLKAADGWDNNGTDDFGFSALPGGWLSYNNGVVFHGIGGYGYWWSATSDENHDAWGWSIVNNLFRRGDHVKDHGFSVRCVKDDIPTSSLIISTNEISDTTFNSATCGGNVINDGGYIVTSRGVCWNITGNPTIEDNITEDGTGLGEFTSNIIGLNANTSYYVRAYSVNNKNTAYGEQKVFTTKEEESNIQYDTLFDARDSITYKTVKIGDHWWMAENLRAIKFNDGTEIPMITNNAEWVALSTPGFCWYDNNYESYGNTFGALYNWYAINTGKLAPEGWHVATSEEWNNLINSYGGLQVAGGSLKETGTSHWLSPNIDATNESGFTALPGGMRDILGGYGSQGTVGYFHTATEGTSSDSYTVVIYNNTTNSILGWAPKIMGLSIRCVKD